LRIKFILNGLIKY